MKTLKPKNLKFLNLYPPRGNSSILEVCDDLGKDFAHVVAVGDGEYEFCFFIKNETISLSLAQIEMIIKSAKKNVSLTYLPND